jgi:hypothetical protein
MNEVPPLSPSSHDFHHANKSGGFPVAFSGKTITILHEALHGETWQLFNAVEIFEGGGESSEAAFL